MSGRLGIGLAHHNQDLAIGIARTGRPPFSAIDHITIAVALYPGFHVRRIGTGDARLCHEKGRTDLAVHQGRQPAFLLFGRAISQKQFHVSRIGGRTVENAR